MGKSSKINCKSASHKLFKDRAKYSLIWKLPGKTAAASMSQSLRSKLRSTGTAKETRFKYPIRFGYGDGSGTAEGRTRDVILAEETTSEDEEVGSSVEEEEEDEEPQIQSTPLIQKSPPPRKLDPAIAVAGNEESEESGTESESESDTATPNVKPLATKPMEDMNAKKPISETVERRLKKKFENNAGKGKKGEDRSFSKAHEHNAFELSKKIWGKEGISGKVKSSAAKSNGKAKANNKAVVALKAEFHSSPDKKVDIGVPMEVDKVPKSSVSNLFDKRFCVSGLEEELLKHSLDMVDSERKATLEARWRKLQIAELELFIERNELVKEHAKEQVHQMLREWKAELNEPSLASSLQQGGSPGSFSSDICRLLQLCEEEDDATSVLAAPKPETNDQNLQVGDTAAFQEVNMSIKLICPSEGMGFLMFEAFGFILIVDKATTISLQFFSSCVEQDFITLNLRQHQRGFPLVDHCNDSPSGICAMPMNSLEGATQLEHHQMDLHQDFEHFYTGYNGTGFAGEDAMLHTTPSYLPSVCLPVPPSAFLGPKCALWDCPRPAQGLDWCQDYCSSFHASLAMNEGPPGMGPILRPGGIVLKDGLLFAALSAKAQGKNVGIPECEGAATAKSPWNASELFDLSVLEGESMREWLFFDKPRRAFESGNRSRGLYWITVGVAGMSQGSKLELKLVDGKKNAKGKSANDTVADLQKQMGRLTAEFPTENKRNVKEGLKLMLCTFAHRRARIFGVDSSI
ncbi:Transcription factor VOZ1 [Hibiscus syriacus]|uniref:Transcription factor VOZ1 n=1 Tax=Hibiscus syriacus TaxID=106335 RepID=A0A6A3A975_HIBSY|nr:Transcription factor VOZ1 [Hibiscus syriacus]